MSPGWILAVDFGTSNTAAAHTSVRSGEVETLPLSHQSNLMPSAVFVESPHSILVGDVALSRAQSNPAAFIPSPKLRVGRGMVRVGGHDVPDSVLVAAVLRSVVERGTAVHNGQRAQQVVLTHPEAWSPVQIQVLIDAAGQVGFDRSMVKTVSEPRAAAHFYTRTNAVAPGGRIAVFDFGGGTLDIAVLEKTDQHAFTVTAARGDNMLGGKNLDAAIRGWVNHQLEDDDPALMDFLRTPAGARQLHKMELSVRRAKELLSEAPAASIAIEDPHGSQRTLSITRGEFNSVIGDQIDRAMTLAWHTFQDAGLTGPQGLTALYLTGGSSRIPLVHERLQALGPVATLDDPKTVVVRGALDAIGATATPTPPAPQGRPYAEPAGATATPRARRNRTLLITAGVTAVAVVGVVGVVGVVALQDSPSASSNTLASAPSAASRPSSSNGTVAPVNATKTQSAPRPREADEKAIRDLTSKFISGAGKSAPADLNPMRCANNQVDESEPTLNVIFKITEFISVSVSGDAGSARFSLEGTDAAGALSKGIMVTDFAYENGGWKWCTNSLQ